MTLLRRRPTGQRRQAFTLVELLVSMAIIGIIGSMVAIALSGARQQAQETRARAYVDRLNLIMLQLYEEEAGRRLGLPSTVWTGETANQSQLIWRRDWLRASLPQSKAEVDAGSGRPGAPLVYSVPFLAGDGTGTLIGPVRRNQVSDRYRERVRRTMEILTASTQSWTSAYDLWSEENQSAECLYLIFATRTLNGEPLLDQLRSRDIADTDEDGMPEIVDPWGTPVLWMRSPVGFFLKNTWVEDETETTKWPTVLELRETIERLGEDPLDILRSDPRHAIVDNDNPTDTIDPASTNLNREIDKKTFFVRPMVCSAGSDEEFDLVQTIPGTERASVSDDLILSLPVSPRVLSTGATISHPTGYPSPIYFPDPFSTVTLVNASGTTIDVPRPLLQRPGAVTDVDSDGIDDSADNVYPSLGL